MRDWSRMDGYLARLAADIYPQPPDEGHLAWGAAAIDRALTVATDCGNVLDLGCGQGQFAPLFEARGISWSGVTLGEDFHSAWPGIRVHEADFSFLPFADASFDMLFARHSLEHSPFPLLTLMEWRRVCRKWLLLVLPTPEHWTVRGRNHYSVLPRANWQWLLERSGWKVAFESALESTDALYLAHAIVPPEDHTVEWWLLCQPAPEVAE